MNGNVTYNGSQLLSGAINVNTTGNIQALNVQVTENGERTITPPEEVDGYAPITIDTNVPIPEPVLDSISITQNGTYTPPSGVDGYDEIIVNVSQEADIQPLTRTITTNGTTVINASDLNVDGFDPVTITTAVDGYTIKTLANTPLPIASFSDGTDNPLKSLTASIVPVQSGSGDPSPTNVRPITGWTEEVIGVNKKNFFDISKVVDLALGSTILQNDNYRSWYMPVNNGETFTISRKNISAPNRFRICFTTELPADGVPYYNNIGAETYYVDGDNLTQVTVTVPNDKTYRYMFIYLSNANETITEAMEIQLELGSTATTYEPYAGNTYTIPFTDSQGNPVEVYGGSVDVVSGVVTPCPYYASYNGEQLTGEWISDRDVYSPNTSPTIGAQVVNIGATGTPFSVQPTSIKSLDGENNVFASTGDVEELKYFADL